MRYIIETTESGNDVNVWNTILSLQKQKLITIVEKGDPIEDMKENLRRITKAIQLLNKMGISNELMKSFIYDKTKVSKSNIDKVLNGQEEFFIKLGIQIKGEKNK